jgi:tetratricopeptide (TPR) repeat protein
MFERPNNISKAYGGGKNIPFGGEQKNPEELEEKRKKTLAKIAQYRQKRLQSEDNANLEDDTVSKAKFSIERGKNLMRLGQLTSAREEFESVSKLVSPKSSLGGEALLQIAICLDSMGRYEEAQEKYKKLTSHRDYTISRQAEKFLFGFEAAEALKTEKYKYDANSKTKSYRPYFDLVSRGEWDTMYVNTETEEEKEKRKVQDAATIFFVVVLFPLCILGGIKTFH